MIADILAAASQGYVAATLIAGGGLTAIVIYLERQAIWRTEELRRDMAGRVRP